MLKKLHLPFILLFISTTALAQDCELKLEGYIIDIHDNTVLQNAEILILETNTYTISNQEGYFSLENLCPGTYEILISHIKCNAVRKKITLTESQTVNFKLEHHLEELEEILLKASQKPLTYTAQQVAIKSDKIDGYSSASLGDITKNIAGVSSLNTGINIVKPIIHGLHSSRVITIQNGVRMQDQEWGLEHAPSVDVNAFQEVSLIKGASALSYSGDAIGGAIVLKPVRILNTDSIFGKTITVYNSNNRGLSVSSSVLKTTQKGWFIGGQGSYKRFGDAQAPDYVLSNTGINYKAFTFQSGFSSYEKSFKLYYSFINNDIGILSSAHIGGLEQFYDAITSGEPSTVRNFTYNIADPRQTVTHHIAKAEYEQRFPDLGKLSLQYDYQRNDRQEFDRRRGELKGIPSIDLLLQTHGFQSKFLFDSNRSKEFEVGIQLQYLDNFADPAAQVRRLIPDYNRLDVGAYITSHWNFDHDYLLEAAIRYDYNHIDAKKFYRIIDWEQQGYDSDFSNLILNQVGGQYLTNPVYDFHNLSFALGVSKTYNNHKLSLNYSLSNRAPNAAELFSDGLHQSVSRIEVGNLRLKRETANQLSLSYKYEESKFKILAEPYLNSIKNYIFIAPTTQGITVIGNAGPFFEYEFLSTDAFIYGIDFNMTYGISENFSVENNTAFLRGEDLKNNEPLIDMPPFNTRSSINYLNDKWKKLTIGLTWEYTARQQNFPDYNFFFDIPSIEENVLIDVSTPPSAFNLFHFNSSIETKFYKQSTLEIGFNIQNIFNTDYRNYLNRLRFFADEVGRNFQIQLKINY